MRLKYVINSKVRYLYIMGLEVNVDKTKYMIRSGDQNAGRSHNMKTDNRSFERVEEFKYLKTT